MYYSNQVTIVVVVAKRSCCNRLFCSGGPPYLFIGFMVILFCWSSNDKLYYCIH